MRAAWVQFSYKGTFSKAECRAERVRAMPKPRKVRAKAQQVTRINNQKDCASFLVARLSYFQNYKK